MIFVDTSVWVAAFRDANSVEADGLSSLLDAKEAAVSVPIYLELLSGASRGDRAKLKPLLGALPLFYPETETWERIEEWIGIAGDAGDRFGVADLLIGAIAAERDAPVWSLDSDFARMASLRLVSVYSPPTQ